MKGTLVNFSAILLGACLGLILRVGISEACKKTILQAMGLAVLFIGIKMSLVSQNTMVLILSLAVGAVLGEAGRLQERLDIFAQWLTNRASQRFGDVGKGFINASLVYCIGAMAIVGSLQDGLVGDASILYAKALIDGTVSIIFTASMGIGVMLAAVPVLLYQGSITLAAGLLQAWVSDTMLAEISGVGGVLIMAIALNMLEITQIKLANLLPGLPVAVLLIWLGWF